jgi:hypothetical protein
MTRVPVQIPITGKDKTKGMFLTLGRSLKTVTKSIFSMKTALVGVAGLAGIGLMVRSSLKLVDANKKLADRLGLTTQQLAGYELASVLAGESVETVQSAFQKLSKNIYEASRNLGTAVYGLDRLNLEAKTLMTMSFDDQIKLISDRISDLSTQSEKLGVASQLFGRAGMVMVNMLDLGADGLSKMQQEALKLGIALSSASAKGIEDFNDSLSSFKFTLRGIANSLTAELAPAMQKITDSLTNFMKDFIKDGGMDEFFNRLYDLLLDITIALTTFSINFVLVFRKLALAFRKMIKVFTFGTTDLFDVDEFEKTIDKMLVSMNNFSNKQLQSLLDYKAQRKLDREEETAQQDEHMKAWQRSQEEKNRGWQQTFLKLSKLRKDSLDMTDQFDTLAVTISTSMGKAFEDIIMGTKNAGDAFRDLGKIILAQIVKMFVARAIMAPITGAFGGFLDGLGFTKPAGGVVGRNVVGGRPYMVGENGQPELFVPSTNGAIIPNNKLGSGGGITIEQNINFATGIQASVRSEVLQLLPAIAQVSKGAVQDAQLRR